MRGRTGELLALCAAAGGADDALQLLANRPQHLVPVRVPVGVADLEVVEVQHHQGEWVLTAAGLLQLHGQDLVEAAMVGQPAEGVGCRQASELQLVPASHGQKRRGDQQADAAQGQKGHALRPGSHDCDDARPEDAQPNRGAKQHAATKRTNGCGLELGPAEARKGPPGKQNPPW